MNIFVAKLNPVTNGEDLASLFGAFGEVEFAKVIIDRETGRSKCFGFIEMNDEAAEQAIAGLDGSEFQGNTIVVKKAEPREDNRGGGGGRSKPRFDNRGGGGGGYGDRRPPRDNY